MKSNLYSNKSQKCINNPILNTEKKEHWTDYLFINKPEELFRNIYYETKLRLYEFDLQTNYVSTHKNHRKVLQMRISSYEKSMLEKCQEVGIRKEYISLFNSIINAKENDKFPSDCIPWLYKSAARDALDIIQREKALS